LKRSVALSGAAAPEAEPPTYRWAVLAAMTAGITALTYTAFMVASVAVQVISAFSLTQVQFGAVTTVPFLAGAALGLPIGMLGDRFGVKHVVSICLAIAVVGTVVRLFLGGFIALLVGNLAVGVGLVAVEANAPKYLSAWFGHREVGLALGILIAGTWVGPALTFGTAYLFSSYRGAFATSALAVFASLMVWLAVARQSKRPMGSRPISMRRHVSACLRSGHLWLCNLSIFLIFGGSIAVTSFLIQALVEGKELTSQAAGLSVMVLDLVAIVGAVGAGWIAQRAGRFRLVVIVLSLLSAAAYYLVWRVPGVGLTLLLLGVVGLVEGGVTPVAKSLIPRMALREHLPMQSVGTAGGIHTSIMYLGAFLVPTYLVAAVAGDDFHKVFLMSALLVAAGGLVNLLIPRSVVGDRKRERKG
jgi:NNP family nitrate/nitrite transporter-like MFS transporter